MFSIISRDWSYILMLKFKTNTFLWILMLNKLHWQWNNYDLFYVASLHYWNIYGYEYEYKYEYNIFSAEDKTLPWWVITTVKLQYSLNPSISSNVYTTSVEPIGKVSFDMWVLDILADGDRLTANGSSHVTVVPVLPGSTDVMIFEGQLKTPDDVLSTRKYY